MRHSRGRRAAEGRGLRSNHVWALLLALLMALGNGCGGVSGFSREDLAVRPFPGETARLLQNAHYFKLMGRPEQALQALEEAHQQDPGNLMVTDSLAKYYEDLGHTERAQELYLEALKLEADHPELNNNYCFSFYLAGRLDKAETCFRKTLGRQPQNKAARNNLGLILCRQGRQEEARRLWQAEGPQVADKMLDQALAALDLSRGVPVAAQPKTPGQVRMADRKGSKPLPEASPEPGAPLSETKAPEAARPAPPLEAAKFISPAPPSDTSEMDEAEETAPPPRHAALAARRRARTYAQAGGVGPGATPPAARQLARVARPDPHQVAEEAEHDDFEELAAAGYEKAVAALTRLPKPRRVLARAPSPALTAKKTLRGPISAQELLETSIDLQNGNGVTDFAREIRSMLHLEGFDTVAIGNYRDFGMGRTVVAYRPEAARVARFLEINFFPQAEFKADPELDEDVKIILGRDLAGAEQPLFAGGQGPEKVL